AALGDEVADIRLAVATARYRVAADDIRDVQERRALEADVDERGLHAGQHARYASLVDVADQASPIRTLDHDLLQHAVLDERRADLARRDVDQDFLFHARPFDQPPRTPTRSRSSAVSHRGRPITPE